MKKLATCREWQASAPGWSQDCVGGEGPGKLRLMGGEGSAESGPYQLATPTAA